ncbi:MAG: c-type cytochrome biogenesis protein CcsB [Anaeromyxobacteraceae bacterium]
MIHDVLAHPLFAATLLAYAVALAAYGAALRWRRPATARLATTSIGLSAALNLALFAQRWIEAGRPPLKTLHETLILLALAITLVHLAIEALHGTRLFGPFAASGALGALVYAVVRWDTQVVRLPPALQSAWFVPHIVVYFVGYGAAFVATAASALQLAAARSPALARRLAPHLDAAPEAVTVRLEAAAFGAIRFGFVLLTLGLLMGAAWAHGAWGDYWAWDPKETWSLVSWLVYAAFLHLHRLERWRGSRGAWLAIAGFAAVAFTYLGIGLLPSANQSAHVYSD